MTTNPQLDLAYSYAQHTGRNIFLTGKAGTGKTTFLKHLVQTTHKRHIVVAPTGVAAINAGGVTIHSFFQLAPGLYLPGVQRREQQGRFGFSRHKLNILRSLDLLVIDEISMVRCDLLDAIDEVLRRYQDRTRPFGGVQLLMIGDLQQLAPVARDDEWQLLRQHYRTPYFFDSIALRQTDYVTIELTEVYRQADRTFVNLLNKVRDNRLDADALRVLNSRFKPTFQPRDDEGYIILTTHNHQANEINERRLAALNTLSATFRATVEGEFPESSYPTDVELTLKVGEQVMFCKNDTTTHAYYNGLIGRVAMVRSDKVLVEVTDERGNRDVELEAQEWTNTKYTTDATSGEIKEEVAGTFRQIPLRAAWAITIHKSQGLTFDRAIINAGRAFSYGQVYVALSRCRTLDGLVLSTPITPSVVMSDPDILQYNRFVEQNQPTASQLADDRRRYVVQTLCDIFDFTAILRQLRELDRRVDEKLSRSYRRYVNAMHEAVQRTENELYVVGQKFQAQIRQMAASSPTYEGNTALQERIGKAVAYYTARTADVLGGLMGDGLPDIDNKRDSEYLHHEFDPLKDAYDLRMAIYIKMAHGFTLEAYWDCKARAAMTDTEPTGPKTKKMKKKKAALPGFDDIQDGRLYQTLRSWREDKAASLGVQPSRVVHLKTLIAIANLHPTDSRELAATPGIGKKLLSAYGAELLDIVARMSD